MAEEKIVKPKWAKNLDARDLKHIRATSRSGCLSLESFKNNIKDQRVDGRDCWECLVIARKLNLTDIMKTDEETFVSNEPKSDPCNSWGEDGDLI